MNQIYILEGRTTMSQLQDTSVRTFISSDEEGIWSLIKNNRHWLSLSVFEFPKEPIYSHSIEERKQFLDEIAMAKKEKEEYELYLSLKEKFESK